MPTLSRWFIKAGLIYFVVALLLAIGLKVQTQFTFFDSLAYFTPVYYHLLLLGWITQIIMGVSHWMFPRFSKEKPRGNEATGWLTFVSLNLGLILRIFSEPLALSNPTPFLKFVIVLSAILQWASFIFLNGGILLIGIESFLPAIALLGIAGRVMEFLAVVFFAIHAWPRVRPFGE